jgi:hypothetical protein
MKWLAFWSLLPIERLDIPTEAGTYPAVVRRSFEVEVSDGQLSIDFNPIEGETVMSTLQAWGLA